MKRWFAFAIVVLVGMVWGGSRVLGGDEACPAEYPYCYSYTIVNQWACETYPGSLTPLCAANPDPESPCTPPSDPTVCGYDNPACYPVCVVGGTVWQGGCSVLQLNVQCNTGPGYCSWTGNLTNCQSSYGNCDEGSQTETRSCCGCPNPPCGDDGGGGGGGSPTPPPVCEATYPEAATLTAPANGYFEDGRPSPRRVWLAVEPAASATGGQRRRAQGRRFDHDRASAPPCAPTGHRLTAVPKPSLNGMECGILGVPIRYCPPGRKPLPSPAAGWLPAAPPALPS